jgi:hypothetical protein
MKTILDVFSDAELLAYARALPANPAFIGSVLFPNKTQNSLDFKYVKGYQRTSAVMAAVQAFGAEASIAQREFGYSYVEGSIPPIKRKIVVNEQELIKFYSPRFETDDQESAIDAIYNDVDNMIEAVQNRAEWMRWKAIVEGKITLNENGIQLSVDYGYAPEQKEALTSTALWSDHTNSDPIDDIRRWCDAREQATGIRPARAVTSVVAMGHILLNAKVRLMVHGDQGSVKPVTWNDINALFDAYRLPPIVTYEATVRSEARDGTITTERLLPADKFILLPSNALGDTLWGPTAEALNNNNIDRRVAPGIIAQVYKTDEPPAHWTKAAGVAIPTYPNADLPFVATVL